MNGHATPISLSELGFDIGICSSFRPNSHRSVETLSKGDPATSQSIAMLRYSHFLDLCRQPKPPLLSPTRQRQPIICRIQLRYRVPLGPCIRSYVRRRSAPNQSIASEDLAIAPKSRPSCLALPSLLSTPQMMLLRLLAPASTRIAPTFAHSQAPHRMDKARTACRANGSQKLHAAIENPVSQGLV